MIDNVSGLMGEGGIGAIMDKATLVLGGIKTTAEAIKSSIDTIVSNPKFMEFVDKIGGLLGEGGINKTISGLKGLAADLELDFKLPDFGGIFADSIVANTTKIRKAITGIFEGVSLMDLLRGKADPFKDQGQISKRNMLARQREAQDRLRGGAKVKIAAKVDAGPSKALQQEQAKSAALQAKISELSKKSKTIGQLDAMVAPDSPSKMMDAALTAAIDDQTASIAERTAALTGLQTVVSEMVEEYSLISQIMNDMTPVNLMAKLNEFGQNLAITSENLVIENKPINVTVNLSVSMNANSIAASLSNKTITTVGTLAKASE